MAMVQVNLRLPREMLLRVDGARGDVSRNLWIRRAVERALATEHAAAAVVAPRDDGHGPAPAEQPENPELQKQIAKQRDAYELQRRRASPPSRPIPPRVPFRRDVKPFQRGDK